ncbi:MAG: ATP-dependent DNA helicase RecQ [Candidatus Sericytochromatia bacterium]|nr:ATP-dependent DNA helicase RecQ [Candidatus Sericytochromatia bacterium]
MPKTWPELLKHYWGPEFVLRSHQQPIVENLCKGQDVLALLPTGEGKSLCFQLAGLCLGGLTLVISPLLALIQEQVAQLQVKNIKAWQLSSQLSPEERRRLLKGLQNNTQTFLYLAPEQLQSPALQAILAENPPRLLVVDEAHCISQWGNSFRPAYRELGKLLSNWHPRPVLGVFTATAPPPIQVDICEVLQLKSPQLYQGNVLRENIAVAIQRVWTPRGKEQYLFKTLAKRPLKTLIYARSRQVCEHLAIRLERKGFSARFYHAGTSLTHRQTSYLHFREPGPVILVATTAFGMGVDIPDIATVIHWQLPESLEAYVQEVGRAGRNRAFLAQALALNLWAEKKTQTQPWEPEVLQKIWKLLGQGRSLLEIQDHLDLGPNLLQTILLAWLEKEAIQPLPGQHYQVLTPKLSPALLKHVLEKQKRLNRGLKKQERSLKAYLSSTQCRRQRLEQYFSAPLQPPCGHCDRCQR